MPTRWRRVFQSISILLIISLLSLFLPDYQQAYAAKRAGEAKLNSRHEIVELRTENSKTYIKGDGKTYIQEQYLEPIHYKENGYWKDIDNKLEAVSGKQALDDSLPYQNKANRYRVGFSKNTAADKLVRFQLDKASLDFSAVDAENVQAAVKGNKITYPGVYPDTDLVYYANNSQVKEEWVLKKYNGQSKLTMALDVKNAEIKPQKDGSIQLVDTKGKELFFIPRPYMIDAKDATSDNIQFNLRTEGNKTYLDMQLDETWLKDPKRSYPVVVDPSVVYQGNTDTLDTFVGDNPATANYGNYSFLLTGTKAEHGKTRSLIKFNLKPLLSGANISSAKLSMYQYYSSTTPETVNLHPITSDWNSSTVNWNTQPTVGSAVSNQSVAGPGWYDLYLTQLARDWYSGKTKNYGISLRQQVETNDRKSYYSSDSTDPALKPKLTITYTIEPLGEEAFWTSAVTNVNTHNGNFYLPETDVSVSGRGIPASVSRSYNSKSNTSGLFGYGWTSNLEQHLYDSGDGPIQYQDGDGTLHSFTPNGDGTYSTSEVLQLELKKNTDGTYVLTDASQTQYLFTTTGYLNKIIDTNGNTTTITYSGAYPATIADAANRTISLTYDANNRVTKLTDPVNRTVEYGYNASGDLATVTKKDASGATLSTVSYGYETNHHLNSITDPNGNTKTVTYTADDKVDTISYPVTVGGAVQTATTTFTYDPANKLTTVTNPKGNKTLYTHNDYGNVVQTTQDPTGLNYKQTFTYNNENELTSQKDANANANSSDATYSYTYDDNGNLKTVTNPLNETTTTTYDENNNPVQETDAEGNTTTNEFDDNNNETSTTDATNKSSAQKVDAYGNVIESTSEMSPGNNLASNGSFEIDKNADNWPDDWTKVGSNPDVISWDSAGLTTEGITLGQKSVKITNPTAATAVASAKVPYDPTKTYAMSGYVKTQNAQGIGRLYVVGFDSAGAVTKTMTYFGITGTQDPTRLHMMLEPAAFPGNTATIQLRGYVGGGEGNQYGGTYWFDGLQMEEAFYGAYNVLENGDLERDANSDAIPDGWLVSNKGTGDGFVVSFSYSGGRCYKLMGDSSLWKSLSQELQLSGSAGAVLTVSGHSRVENPNPSGGMYGYIIETYLGATKQETFTHHFDKSKTHDWQHQAAEIKATKSFDKVKVYYEYSQQSGAAWFDTAKVSVGSITTRHQYDANGNYEVKMTDPQGRVTESGYDTVGNQTSEKVGAHTTTFDYDGLDRLKKVTDAKTGVTQYQYDDNGNKTKVTNARNKETAYLYNEIDQVSKVTDANNQFTSYDYDLNGNQTKITYPNSNFVEFGYNAVDRQTSVKYNGTERYAFAYDPNGNLTQETDKSANQTTTYEYDADNKVKAVQHHDGRTDYVYDKNGYVTQQKHTIGIFSYIHDYAYNSVNQLIQIKANSTNVAAFTYNENDQIASRKNNDGTLSLFAYNGAGDLVKQTIYDKNGNPIDAFSYTYDTKGNITSITSKSGTTTYDYDELDQLVKETGPDGTITEYTYDAAGNRTLKKVTKDGTTTPTTYDYDDADQLTAVNGQSYTYDENGNLTGDGSKTYAYDAENRLTQVQSGSETVQFTYRADGMRTRMTTSAGTTYFHYDENNNVSFETNASGQVIASYTFDGENRPVSMTRDGQTYYFQLNGQGDVIALTDANGNVVSTYAYDAYGRITAHTGTIQSPYLYRGYRYDWETGFYYLQSRYYNPETGRFLTRDTFEGEENEPLSLNKYTYGHNNPVMNVDPDGNNPILIALAAAARYVASAAYWALVATVIYMLYKYARYGQRWSYSVFVSTYKWNFLGNLLPGAWRSSRWLKSKVLYIGQWLGAKLFWSAYRLRGRVARRTIGYRIAYRINKSYYFWKLKRTARNWLRRW